MTETGRDVAADLRALKVTLSGPPDVVTPAGRGLRLVSDPTLAWLVAVVEAAQEVSRIEATGVLPDFQPLADALESLHSQASDEGKA